MESAPQLERKKKKKKKEGYSARRRSIGSECRRRRKGGRRRNRRRRRRIGRIRRRESHLTSTNEWRKRGREGLKMTPASQLIHMSNPTKHEPTCLITDFILILNVCTCSTIEQTLYHGFLFPFRMGLIRPAEPVTQILYLLGLEKKYNFE